MHYKNGNILHIYSIKIESHILRVCSTKTESCILYIYSTKIESHLYRRSRIWLQISCLSKYWKCWVLFELSKCIFISCISPEHIFQCFGRVSSFWWCCVPRWRRNLFWEVFYRSWSGGIAGTGCSIFLYGRRLFISLPPFSSSLTLLGSRKENVFSLSGYFIVNA